MEELRYTYRPTWWRVGLAGLFFAGLAVFIGHDAATNDRGLILNGIIRFDVRDATAFYWILAAACAALVVVALLALVRALGPPRALVLGREAAVVPAGLARDRPRTIPYARIERLEVTTVRAQRFLTIHGAGVRASVAQALLPEPGDFDRVVAEIERRRAAATR